VQLKIIAVGWKDQKSWLNDWGLVKLGDFALPCFCEEKRPSICATYYKASFWNQRWKVPETLQSWQLCAWFLITHWCVWRALAGFLPEQWAEELSLALFVDVCRLTAKLIRPRPTKSCRTNRIARLLRKYSGSESTPTPSYFMKALAWTNQEAAEFIIIYNDADGTNAHCESAWVWFNQW
jgi:hypothetical protein